MTIISTQFAPFAGLAKFRPGTGRCATPVGVLYQHSAGKPKLSRPSRSAFLRLAAPPRQGPSRPASRTTLMAARHLPGIGPSPTRAPRTSASAAVACATASRAGCRGSARDGPLPRQRQSSAVPRRGASGRAGPRPADGRVRRSLLPAVNRRPGQPYSARGQDLCTRHLPAGPSAARRRGQGREREGGGGGFKDGGKSGGGV